MPASLHRATRCFKLTSYLYSDGDVGGVTSDRRCAGCPRGLCHTRESLSLCCAVMWVSTGVTYVMRPGGEPYRSKVIEDMASKSQKPVHCQ